MPEWFYVEGDSQKGPIPFDDLTMLLRTKKLPPDTLVWCEEMSDWACAQSLAQFAYTGSTSNGPPSLTCEVRCPNCNRSYEINVQKHLGGVLECEKCGNTFVVRSSEQHRPISERHSWHLGNDVTGDGASLPKQGLAGTRELTPEEIEVVRCRLQEHAETVPYHGVHDFSKCVKGISGYVIPVYSAHLQSLYERRKYHRKEKPYLGEPVPPLQVTERNIDLWSYDFTIPSGFVAASAEHIVDNSQKVRDCEACRAVGHVICDTCSGHGQLVCPKCDGQKTVGCGGLLSGCGGSGTIMETQYTGRKIQQPCKHCTGALSLYGTTNRCPFCKGSQVLWENETVQVRVRCPNCGGSGVVPCKKCKATGIVVCGKCKGSGRLVCSTCEGAKQIMSYLVLGQSFEPASSHVAVPTSQVESYVLERLQAMDYRRVLVRTKREFPDELENAPGCRTGIPWLASEIRRLVVESKRPVQQECRMARQQYELFEGSIVFAEYVYEDTVYDLWLVGKDMAVDGTSPFARFTESLVVEAHRAWNDGNKRIAKHYMRQAEDVGKRDPDSARTLSAAKTTLPSGLTSGILGWLFGR